MTTAIPGVRPDYEIDTRSKVEVGAVGGEANGDAEDGTDEEIEQLAGDLQDVVGDDREGVQSGGVEGLHEAGRDCSGEEGVDAQLRRSPTLPSQDEIDRHFATHVPRR